MAKKKEATGWKKGPLPPDTYNWGGVVPVGMDSGFYFADFHGSHVEIVPGKRVLEPDDVAWYNNDLQLPQQKAKAGRRED